MGVTVSRLAMLSHCQALSQACNYSEGRWCHRNVKRNEGSAT